MGKKVSSESVVKYIRRRTPKKYSSEEKIRIVIDGLRGEDSISSLCRREGIPANLYYSWSKDFLEVGSVLWAIPPEKPAPLKCLTLKIKWTLKATGS
jgi:transposase